MNLPNCKCGASRIKIRGGGTYFRKLRRPITVCVAKACPFPRKRANLQFR